MNPDISLLYHRCSCGPELYCFCVLFHFIEWCLRWMLTFACLLCFDIPCYQWWNAIAILSASECHSSFCFLGLFAFRPSETKSLGFPHCQAAHSSFLFCLRVSLQITILIATEDNLWIVFARGQKKTIGGMALTCLPSVLYLKDNSPIYNMCPLFWQNLLWNTTFLKTTTDVDMRIGGHSKAGWDKKKKSQITKDGNKQLVSITLPNCRQFRKGAKCTK